MGPEAFCQHTLDLAHEATGIQTEIRGHSSSRLREKARAALQGMGLTQFGGWVGFRQWRVFRLVGNRMGPQHTETQGVLGDGEEPLLSQRAGQEHFYWGAGNY